MTPDAAIAQRLLSGIRRSLGSRWDFAVAEGRLEIRYRALGTTYCPPRRRLAWPELIATLESAFAMRGVRRDHCAPLRWGRDTDLMVSAVQSLDPLLKDGRPVTHREGFLTQPVVRFTGERDCRGALVDGYLTSFVNVSRIEPIRGIEEYGAILDDWLFVLSRLGFHARHLSFAGRLDVWRRREVAGITLMFGHGGVELGDIVLLWNVDNPDAIAVDLGTGLERLAWARNPQDWTGLVFGELSGAAPATVLDALRTATLLVGSGIRPSGRGAGAAIRRVLGTLAPGSAPLGISSAVRSAHRYWTTMTPLPVPWHAAVVEIEQELARRAAA
ncbi:hypothetical protein [Jiangella endophytica]|uniref:hypothetical protein n=1 Tax=Jiangella endophytica TaxID=1623398 RepID=UPI000E34AF91|nr:hypothetical protein [Jiangella endophytica]